MEQQLHSSQNSNNTLNGMYMNILKKEWSQRDYDKKYVLWGLVPDTLNYDPEDWDETFQGKVDFPQKWLILDVADKPYEVK